MDEGLRFTEEAELNRYFFYSDLNEINIFVEDKEYEYETIFERLLENYHISSIIAAGGKNGVKKAFEEFGISDKQNPCKNNFFIVDGDFDRYIHQEDMINNSHFIYLGYYNIENYIIDEQAVLKFSKGKLHMVDRNVREKIEFHKWKTQIVDQAKKLFLLYCAVQKSLPGEPNVSRSEYLFIDDKTGFEREGAYTTYYDHIVSIDADITIEIERISNLYEQINGNDYYGLICGKFLLTSLYVYLRKKINKAFQKEDLKWNLLCDFDISSLSFVKESIDAVCR